MSKYFVPLFCLILVIIMFSGCISGTNTGGTPKNTQIPSPTQCKNNCSGICYDSSRQSCCNDKIYEGDWRSMSDGSCRKERTEISDCGGVILQYPQDDGKYCCGGLVFDQATQHCCSEIIKSGGGWNWQDCGNTCYHLSNQSCCNGKVYEGQYRCCLESGYDSPTLLTCPEGKQCCNDRNKGPTCFDPGKSMCSYIF
jgi:hypothetical protein